MKKCIKTNLYAAVDVMAVVAFLLLVATIVQKKMFFYSLATGGVALLMVATQALLGKTKVDNLSGKTIYTKGEEDCDATELLHGNSRYDIDGVNVEGTVYKVCDGCHTVIENGELKVKSITGGIINSVCGGGDMNIDCWDKLFKAIKKDETKP